MAVIRLLALEELMKPSYLTKKIAQYERETGNNIRGVPITPHFIEWYEDEKRKDREAGINIYEGMREKYLSSTQLKDKKELEK